METTEYNNMSNSELTICLEAITNEFQAKKNQILNIASELEKLKIKHDKIVNVINSRKNTF